MLLDGVFSLMERRESSAPSFGSSVSEQEQRAERERERELSAVVVSFNRLISVRPLEASSNQIVLVGRSPAHVFWGIPQ